MKIYLDTCICIYVVERHAAYASVVEAQLARHVADEMCYSPLVRMECLVKPYKINDNTLLQLYETFLSAHRMLDLTQAVFDEAANLRARHAKLKTPDAIHLAAAQHYDCTEFWTNDNRLDDIAPGLIKRVV